MFNIVFYTLIFNLKIEKKNWPFAPTPKKKGAEEEVVEEEKEEEKG